VRGSLARYDSRILAGTGLTQGPLNYPIMVIFNIITTKKGVFKGAKPTKVRKSYGKNFNSDQVLGIN